MEQMDSSLSKVVPLLLRLSKSATSVPFGPVAVQLLKCVQAIHERRHVVVDVKPENFMLSGTKGKGTTTPQSLAARIRLLDVALVQPWGSAFSSHRANETTSGVSGTPLYASLNVHNGQTPSRRDDLEALGYLMAELAMKIACGNASVELPWSGGKSDDEIGEMKAHFVDNSASLFYKNLGSPSVIKIFKKYIDTVRAYTFKQIPDYDELIDLLAKLKIPTPKAPTPSKATKPAVAASSKRAKRQAPATSGVGKRTTRSSAFNESSDEESPYKMARDESYMEYQDLGESNVSSEESQGDLDADEDASFTSAQMDWEPLPKGKENPETSHPKTALGLTIVVTDGPHKGVAVHLIKGQCDSIVVGRKPVTDGGVALALTQDANLDETHIRIDLAVTKRLSAVIVTDLKSRNGSFVGSEKIRSGKDMKVFRGDSVKIGNSVLLVANLDFDRPAVFSPPKVGARSQKSVPTREKVSSDASVAHNPELPRLKRRGVRIEVTAGPHKGDAIDLEDGHIEILNVGSKPSGQQGTMMTLHKDKSLKANHVRIELVKHNKLKAVNVADKSKGETKVNEHSITKGRAFINDHIKIGETVLAIKSL